MAILLIIYFIPNNLTLQLPLGGAKDASSPGNEQLSIQQSFHFNLKLKCPQNSHTNKIKKEEEIYYRRKEK